MYLYINLCRICVALPKTVQNQNNAIEPKSPYKAKNTVFMDISNSRQVASLPLISPFFQPKLFYTRKDYTYTFYAHEDDAPFSAGRRRQPLNSLTGILPLHLARPYLEIFINNIVYNTTAEKVRRYKYK